MMACQFATNTCCQMGHGQTMSYAIGTAMLSRCWKPSELIEARGMANVKAALTRSNSKSPSCFCATEKKFGPGSLQWSRIHDK